MTDYQKEKNERLAKAKEVIAQINKNEYDFKKIPLARLEKLFEDIHSNKK